jgi:hypothetical protein
MFPPLIGLLLLLLTLGCSALALIVAVGGLLSGRPVLLRRGLTGWGAMIAGYGAIWLVGLLGASSRVVPVGEEIHFCGVDCHLHVSVAKASRGSDVGVTLRFRSDARQADEFPYLLTYAVVDGAGRRYPPSAGIVSAPLKAGKTVKQELRFSVPPDAPEPRLVVSYDSFMDYLIAGRANPLVQRRTRLDLGT